MVLCCCLMNYGFLLSFYSVCALCTLCLSHTRACFPWWSVDCMTTFLPLLHHCVCALKKCLLDLVCSRIIQDLSDYLNYNVKYCSSLYLHEMKKINRKCLVRLVSFCFITVHSHRICCSNF